MAPAAASSLTIGVLLFDDVQLLDLAAVDLFAMCSKEYLRACDLPAPLVARGLDQIIVYYISSGGPEDAAASPWQEARTKAAAGGAFTAPAGAKLLPATPTLNLSIALTHNLTSPEVAPGKLDILLVPGPHPKMVPSEAEKQFMQSHAAEKDTDMLVICTGIFPMGRAGVLDDRECTGPRPLVDMQLRKLVPNAKWRDDVRWAVDRNRAGPDGKPRAELWTAGGISNGCDMVGAYLREKLSPELGGFVCEMADIGDRGIEYGQGKLATGLGFGWTLLRSSWMGLLGRGTIQEKS
jgi:hypothetical protein